MNKKAFSLFELILVVIIIGLVYSLVLGKIGGKKNLHIQKLENLQKILPIDKELVVYNKCTQNNLKIDNIFQNIKVYKVENEALKEVEFAPYHDKENLYQVCLRFRKYKNGSTSSFIIKQDDRYIVFYPYFKKSEVYHDEQEAIDAFLEKKLYEEYKNEI